MDKTTKEILNHVAKNTKVKRTELTLIGQTMKTTPIEEVKLDKYIKNLLAYKPILAHIFKETVHECKDMSYEEIERCIEGEPDISIVGVNPGYTNQKIEGQTQENIINGEGIVTFDIRTCLILPKTSEAIGVKLLIDVEAQKEDTPGYDIVLRAIFYCSRMLSSQLSVEFSNKASDKEKYNNLKKVYSIWICTETAQYKANTIEKLQQKYNIPTTIEFEKEVSDMTGFEERLIRTGREEGRMSAFLELVKTNILTIQQVSEIAGVDVQELEMMLKNE